MESHIFTWSTVVVLSGRIEPTTGRDVERCPMTKIQMTLTFAPQPAPKEMAGELLSSSFTFTSSQIVSTAWDACSEGSWGKTGSFLCSWAY